MTDDELRSLIAAIDANVRDLMADGKLAAAKYAAGDGGPSADRAAGLRALLEARAHYQKLLDERTGGGEAAAGLPSGWEFTVLEPTRACDGGPR